MTTPLPKIAEVNLKHIAMLLRTGPYVLTEAERHAAADAIDAAGRLPATTDGKPFVRGTVYVNGFKDGEPFVFSEEAHCRFVGDNPYIAQYWGERIKKCYSTRALAEAAAKEPTDGQA